MIFFLVAKIGQINMLKFAPICYKTTKLTLQSNQTYSNSLKPATRLYNMLLGNIYMVSL